eukprot:COSAG06_NODE_4648_length_4068_cov_2.547493_2_plen_100_part_00
MARGERTCTGWAEQILRSYRRRENVIVVHMHEDRRPPCKKTALYFEFSLCLPRACLGKMIIFILKSGQKVPFSHLLLRQSHPPAALGSVNIIIKYIIDI